MSCAPRSTFLGFFMWLPEPSSSPAPHFDGQRCLSGGTFHCANATSGTDSRTAENASFFIFSSWGQGIRSAANLRNEIHLVDLAKAGEILLDGQGGAVEVVLHAGNHPIEPAGFARELVGTACECFGVTL